MAYQRILTVQDISCLGQCSITVALPILSACGHETCILPSAVLSTHTGGFGNFHVHDLTDSFPGIIQHWKSLNMPFDTVYTGYLGNTKHVEYVKDIFHSLVATNGLRIVDPAMADNGKLYWGFDQVYVDAMKELCKEADVIIPNITEACFLTDTPYQEEADEAFVKMLMAKLEALCPTVVLTGVGYKMEETGVLISRKGAHWHYVHEKISKSFHGTGDVFASAFVGACGQGKSMEEAAQIAADYTASCIRATCDDPDHWYGVKFEAVLPKLVQKLFP